MNKQDAKMELLENMPVRKALLALGLPTMTGMLINAMYNLADTYFVGGLGTDQMGAVTIAFPLGQIMTGLGLLFGNGAAACLSRLLGRRDKDTADKAASTALYSSVLSGIILMICFVIFLKPLLKQAGALESVMPYALAYTRIYIVFSVFNVFNVTMNNIVSSEGAARTAMCALIAGAVLNVILDPVFIYVLRLGVAGAAIATAISQMASAFIYLFYIFQKKSIFSYRIKSCCFSREIMSEILKIGIPTLIFQLLTSISISMINHGAKEYGSSALAAMGPVTKIMRLFTRDDLEMIRIGSSALRANGLSFLFFGFHTVYCFLFLVMGKAKEGCILGACRQGICFIPAMMLLPAIWGLHGVLYAQPIADAAAAFITLFMAVNLHKKLSV